LTSRLVVGDLVLDAQRHVAQRGGREIPLTAREFAFLAHLARNAGRVVSRAELMEQVWDDHRNSNIIDVYAGRLRRKIDEGERVPLFSTVRGLGFVLEMPKSAPSPASRQRKRTTRRE
jgi:two-component system OmpR family response regulator